MWSNIILTKGGKEKEDPSSKGPPSRYKHAGVLVPTSSSFYDLYLFGGRSGTFPLKDFWKLDLTKGKWEEVTQGNCTGEWPPHLQEHSMVYYQGKIYIFGGEISLSYGEDQSPLWIFDLEGYNWRRWGSLTAEKEKEWKKIRSPELRRQALTKTPLGRRGHTALVWNGYMLIYGGYRDLKGSLGDLWAFHFETESWHLFSSFDFHKKAQRPWYLSLRWDLSMGMGAFPFPPPRHSHTSLLLGNSLYIHGGMQDLQELSDLWKFDLQSRTWIPIRTKYGPGPLHGHVSVLALDSLLFLGGERGGKAVDEFWRFDLLAESWEKIVLNGCRPCARVWAWGGLLPVIYKRVQGLPGGGKVKKRASSSPSPAEENKYWWDYDDSILSHPEDDFPDDPDTNPHPQATERSQKIPPSSTTANNDKKSSLGAGLFQRFAYGDYQALSESNSVCLSEEEASPLPSKVNTSRGLNHTHQHQLDLPLKRIEEQQNNATRQNLSESDPIPLIDLGEEEDSLEEINKDSGKDSSPEESVANALPSSSSTSRTRRSESATCLQLAKKTSVKKSASVRFADLTGTAPSTSSSSHVLLSPRECTSDYSSMEMGINNFRNGFENPNYHGSQVSNNRVMEAYELGEINPAVTSKGPASTTAPAKPPLEEGPFHYQVSTPNYMLLIGGNESHSSMLTNRKQPLSIWRLRVTRDLFSTPTTNGNGNGMTMANSTNGIVNISDVAFNQNQRASQRRIVKTTGF